MMITLMTVVEDIHDPWHNSDIYVNLLNQISKHVQQVFDFSELTHLNHPKPSKTVIIFIILRLNTVKLAWKIHPEVTSIADLRISSGVRGLRFGVELRSTSLWGCLEESPGRFQQKNKLTKVFFMFFLRVNQRVFAIWLGEHINIHK